MNAFRLAAASHATAVLLWSALPQQAAAQTSTQTIRGLDEVVVTARRVEESQQSVPIAVSALTGQTLEQRSVVSIDDIMRNVPSLTFGTGTRSSSTPFFGIRGINSSDLVGSIDPSVGIYQNEVIMQRPNGVLSSVYDVESIQVLRGPQGTLFGRNTTGGAILINSRKPQKELGGYLTGSYGSRDYVNAEGAINVPLMERVQLRVAGRYVDRDGYVKSEVTGQDQADLGSDAFRVTLATQPTDNIDSTFYYDRFHQSTNGSGAVSAGLIPAGIFMGTGFVNANSNVGDAGNRTAIANAGAVTERSIYRNQSNELQFDRTTAWTASNITTVRLSDALSLKNIVAYRDVDYSSSVDLDASIARVLTVGTENSTHQVTEELQLLGTLDRFNFIVGAFYFREKGSDLAPSYTNIPLARVDTPPAQGLTGADNKNTSYSLFGEVHWSLTDKLKLNLGVRGTRDKREIVLKSGNVSNPFTAPTFVCAIGTTISTLPGAGPNGEPVITTAIADPCQLKKKKTWEEPTWMASLDYQATDDLLLYLAHRKGYHSGAFNQRATFDLPNDFAEPETLYDIEAGVKSDFLVGDMRGRANVAAYYG